MSEPFTISWQLNMRKLIAAAKDDVESSSYFNNSLDNWKDGMINAIGDGPAAQLAATMSPDIVLGMIQLLGSREDKLRHIHMLSEGMADVDVRPTLGHVYMDPAAMQAHLNSNTGPVKIDKTLRSGNAVILPQDPKRDEIQRVLAANDQLQARVHELEVENAKLSYDSDIENQTVKDLMRDKKSLADRLEYATAQADAQQAEIENLNSSMNSATETIAIWEESNQVLSADVSQSLAYITSWASAYRNDGLLDGLRLPELVNEIVNGYGALFMSLSDANAALGRATDRLERTLEMIREIDILGAYVKRAPHENEEDRLETLKAVLARIEDQDDTIEALHRALRNAQGQPRRAVS